jgi:hypothetical protein
MAVSTDGKIQPWMVYARSTGETNAKEDGFWYPEQKGKALTLIRGEALPNFRKE